MSGNYLPALFEDSDLSALPTSNPGSGKPWLVSGVIVVGAFGTLSLTQPVTIYNNAVPLTIECDFANGIDLFVRSNPGFRAPGINFNRAKGTKATPLTVDVQGYETGCSIGYINFRGHDGTDYATGAGIYTQVDQTWSPTGHGAHIGIYGCNIGSTTVRAIAQFGGLDPTDQAAINTSGITDDILFFTSLGFLNNKYNCPKLKPVSGNTPSISFINGDNTGWADIACGVITCNGTGAMTLPKGTTAQRPTPAAGMQRWNTDTTRHEFYNGSAWVNHVRLSGDSGLGSMVFSDSSTISYSDITLARNAANQLDIRANTTRFRNSANGADGAISTAAITASGNISPASAGGVSLSSSSTPFANGYFRGEIENYNTGFSGDTNFERGYQRWNSNVYEIGIEIGGTGVARQLTLSGPSNININPTGLATYVLTTNQLYSSRSGLTDLGANNGLWRDIWHRGVLYNYNASFSGLTNYERGFARWATNVYTIGTEQGGTGVARDVVIQRGGVTSLTFSASSQATFAGVAVLGSYTVATLPSASANTRGRAFVTDSSLTFSSANLGSTVTAGGANLVPVWSNGTNWVIG